jgi:hypothetical protein
VSALTEAVEWRETPEGLRPVLRDRPAVRVSWCPQPGSQEAYVACPVTEVLYCGTRGPGKTDGLLASFGQYVDRGFGVNWRGIIFRRTFPELKDIIAKSEAMFPAMFPGAKYNRGDHTWTFPKGEVLIFSFMERESDYQKYHGHAYPFIGWEELTNWPTDVMYKKMFSTLRSAHVGIPRMIRSTTNPYGPGHNWVKRRFDLPVPPGSCIGRIVREPGVPERVAIHGHLRENKVLLYADPNYEQNIVAAASNPSELAAWRDGSWDITSGGMFDDLWLARHHVLPHFHPTVIPRGWYVDRAYDHGQAKPFSVGWWAESNGEPIVVGGRRIGEVPGDLIRFAEWYGWNGNDNQGLRMGAEDIGRGIVDRERSMGILGRVRVGPADSSIFDRYDAEKSVAGDMERVGVHWNPVDKGPGSRKQGWQQMRKLIRRAVPPEGGYREEPGLFVLESCRQFIRTVPPIPRDRKDPDDVDTDVEDHIADEARYRVRSRDTQIRTASW